MFTVIVRISTAVPGPAIEKCMGNLGYLSTTKHLS